MATDSRAVLQQASQARQAGRFEDAAILLEQLLADRSDIAPAWNLLGIVQLEQGRPADAVASLSRAVEEDPEPPFAWLNLAKAQRALGDHLAELRSLETALSRDAYFLPAILARGETLRTLGRDADAAEHYRLLLAGIGDTSNFPPAILAQLEDARAFLGRSGDDRLEQYSATLAGVASNFPSDDLSRVRAYAEQKAGKRKVYVQQPTGSHFPYLPAIEFFDRKLFPWFEKLESHTAEIRDELLTLWADDDPNFRPYVAYPPGTPANQWTALNHSPRWSAWFFWENGVRNEVNCTRCPKTAAALDQAAVLDIRGKGPTAMFSVLKPRTRIPPHTGTTNVRTTIHLPLVVPPGCGFRVGAETREWREGECWAFDDTIEHEAWNDSDSPRAILIIDSWNPLLTEAEREAVRRLE